MKNITFLAITVLTLTLLFTSCTKEDFDNSSTVSDDFIVDTIIYDAVNQFSFSLSRFYNGQLNVIGGSTGFGTNLSHEMVGNQMKWTLSGTVEDGVIVTQTLVFYTQNEDPGTYAVSEYHMDHSDDDNLDWISPDMTGDITVTSLSDSLVSGSISLERITVDTTYNFSSNMTDVINL